MLDNYCLWPRAIATPAAPARLRALPRHCVCAPRPACRPPVCQLLAVLLAVLHRPAICVSLLARRLVLSHAARLVQERVAQSPSCSPSAAGTAVRPHNSVSRLTPPCVPLQVLERRPQLSSFELEPTGSPSIGTVARLPPELLSDTSVPYAWAVRVPGWSEDTGLLYVALLHHSGLWKVDTMSSHSPCWCQPLDGATLPRFDAV